MKTFQSINHWIKTANQLLTEYKKKKNMSDYLKLLQILEWPYTKEARNLCQIEKFSANQLCCIADRIRAFVFY